MNRIAFNLIIAAGCILGMWQAAKFGAGRTLAQSGVARNDPAATSRAISWSSSDASTYTAQGLVFERLGNYPEAIRALERAVQLRPRDYFPWMLLGVTRDLNGDQLGAMNALRQSIAVAPTYGKQHWLLGNLLLRTGPAKDAFQELRFAAVSDERYLPNVIDLAWGASRNDASVTLALLQPLTDSMRMPLAIFFARQKQREAAIDQFRKAGSYSEKDLNTLVTELLKAGLFTETAEVWSLIHGTRVNEADLLNAGFEEDIPVGQTGFGWQISPAANVTMSVDTAEWQSGSRSLRFDFQGNSKPDAILVSQVVLVKPNSSYLLRFQVNSKDLVSAAPPIVLINEPTGGKTIVQSTSLAGATGWREASIEFTTSANAEAVLIAVSRQACANSPCPAVGTLWLDSFQLEKR